MENVSRAQAEARDGILTGDPGQLGLLA
jgi:hypothetical protein